MLDKMTERKILEKKKPEGIGTKSEKINSD